MVTEMLATLECSPIKDSDRNCKMLFEKLTELVEEEGSTGCCKICGEFEGAVVMNVSHFDDGLNYEKECGEVLQDGKLNSLRLLRFKSKDRRRDFLHILTKLLILL